MDVDISRWILEFIARKVNDENLVHRLFTVLRVPSDDYHIRKTIFIKRIESEVLEASVSRRTLDSLESIAEIDKSQGILISPSMKSAYCTVAVDCTVRFIEEDGNTEGSKYFGTMETLWWKRAGRLNELGLDSEELSKWREELEKAISDAEVTRRLSKMNSRNDALREVRVYVNEVWKSMGPTFLEVAAKGRFSERGFLETNRDSSPLPAAREQVGGTGSAPISVEENAERVNELGASREKAEGSIDVVRCIAELSTALSGDARRTVKMNGSNDVTELVAPRKQVTCSRRGAIDENSVHVNEAGASREQVKGSSDVARLVVKLPTAKSGDVNELVSPREQVRRSSRGSVEEGGDHINKGAASRWQSDGLSSNIHREVEGKSDELPASEKQAKESSGGARMTVGMNGTLGNELGISDRCVTRNERHVQETPGKDKAETPPENITRRRKHVGGPSVRHGRAKTANVKKGDLEPSSSKLDSLCTPTVNEVREELRSSMQELHAAVKDPLPGAIQIAERVVCELASRRSSPVCILEKKTTRHSKSSDVDKGNRSVQANGASSEAVQANGASSEAVQANGASSEAVQANGASSEAVQANGAHSEAVQANGARSKAVQANGTTAEASQGGRGCRGTDQGNEPDAESLQTTEGCTEVPVACQNNADVCGNEGDGGAQHAKHQTGGLKPSLLERNHTARTYEWDDSNADVSEQQPSSSQRIRLPSLEGTTVEPLPRDELTKFARRRKRKRWSAEEEDTLRESVEKFGKGNWKFILTAHRDVFQDRTEVDLKDKWRNLTK